MVVLQLVGHPLVLSFYYQRLEEGELVTITNEEVHDLIWEQLQKQ